MDITDIARWQFAITTVYHFLFVPITIGLSAIIAGYEITWLRTRNPQWLRLTRFFGKLFLINFAIGVVTGIVQEFQFGMNWSDYSRFVGDIFGAPLAIEGLLAFFLESTFLGLWIFGWDRLSGKLHAACIVLVHLGTLFSAYFILAANSWMQNPVGYSYNAETGRAEMDDFAALLFNKVQLVTFPHVVLSAYMTGAAFVVGVGLWQMMRKAKTDDDRSMYRKAVRTGAIVVARQRNRRRRQRRHPGQDHDRGPADEDGGRGGALRDRGPGRLLDLPARHAWTVRRRRSRSRSRGSCPTLPPAPPTARSRASTRSASEYIETYGQRPRRDVLLARRLHAGHPAHLLDASG